jgi:hypothetical protein
MPSVILKLKHSSDELMDVHSLEVRFLLKITNLQMEHLVLRLKMKAMMKITVLL